MINLLAAYYENIGPFREKCCSIFFDEGKYLIKAPIGSGKSFLFFDAPRYALYKDSSRNMLNLHSKSGEISLIFEIDGEYYMIKRILKSTRIGNDSCASQLFNIQYDGDNLLKDIKGLTNNDEILQRGENFIPSFESTTKWKLEEITFKNETDLQTQIECILPPKEVFLSTVFLLQDADNIFEMKPSERLIVLKNVFNLLGIDDAKEKIQERKREIQYKLKALQDHSLEDNKLRNSLKALGNNIQQLESDDEIKINLEPNNQFFEDIEPFLNQLSLNNFSLNGLDKESFEQVEKIIQNKSDNLVKLDAQIQELNQQKYTLIQQKQQNEKDIQQYQIKIQELQRKIENIDTKKGEELKNEKIGLYQRASSLDENQDFDSLKGLVDWRNNEIKEDNTMPQEGYPTSLRQVYDLLQTLKDAGVKIKTNLDFEKVEFEKNKLESKNWQEKQDREIEKLTEQKIRKDEEILKLKDRLEELEKGRQNNSDFDCPDLCKKCPHITAINKQQFVQYSQQKESLLHQIENSETEKKDAQFDQKIEELKKEKNPEGYEGCDLWLEFDRLIKKHTKFTEELKIRLLGIDYASRESQFKELENIQSEIQKIDRSYLQREEGSKQLEFYQQEKITTESSLQHSQKDLEKKNIQIQELNENFDKISQEKQKNNPSEIQEQQHNIKQIFQLYTQLEQLVQDNVNNQNLTKELEEKEKKLGRLYTIFSKELVLIALSDLLPTLCEIINGLLIQCVDYTLQMSISENNEKLELEAKILDEKGEREVKSLSGGQRTILKLVWMLAISSYLHTPLLFLDETINNLDSDTVGKVSEMINNFVKQRTMKFYTVTHNKEIQEMEIWDKIIEIPSISPQI